MNTEEKCVVCKGPMEHKYAAMQGWDVQGAMCGKCYSKKIFDHYPGQHGRTGLDKR